MPQFLVHKGVRIPVLNVTGSVPSTPRTVPQKVGVHADGVQEEIVVPYVHVTHGMVWQFGQVVKIPMHLLMILEF